MNLEIPEGTNVQIIVGDSPLLARGGEIIRGAEVGSPGRSHAALVKVFSIVALLGSGFLIGVLVGGHGSRATAFPPGSAAPAPPVAQAFPAPPPRPMPSSPPRMPLALAPTAGPATAPVRTLAWRASARDDLVEIVTYIAERNPLAARRIRTLIED